MNPALKNHYSWLFKDQWHIQITMIFFSNFLYKYAKVITSGRVTWFFPLCGKYECILNINMYKQKGDETDCLLNCTTARLCAKHSWRQQQQCIAFIQNMSNKCKYTFCYYVIGNIGMWNISNRNDAWQY